MAKYCIQCGAPLEEGKCPRCTNEKKVVEPLEKYKDTVLDSFIGIYKKPIDTMKSFIRKENFILSLILLGISGFLLALFTTFFIGHTASMTSSFFMGQVEPTFHFSFYLSVSIKALLVIYLIYTLVACLLYFISDKVFKGESSLEKMFCLLGSMTFILIPATILYFISMYISFSLLFLVILATSVMIVFNLYEGLSIASKIKSNYKGYTFLITIMILILLFLYIIPGILH